MKKPNEDDILETTLSIAEKGYPEAYRFLLNAYEESPSSFGPQTFYFLACLAGGANMLDLALAWLRKAIQENSWWYRPEVLEDDDFAALKNDAAFLSLKAISDDRYAAAVSKSTAIFSWKKKMADNLFLAIHGNTQNGDVARADWEPIVGTSGLWQLETVQSAEPDGYGTYRWSYDSTSYLPVAASIESVQKRRLSQNCLRRLFCRMRYAFARGHIFPCTLRSVDPAKPLDSGIAGSFRRYGSCHFAKEHRASDFLRRRG